MKRFLKRLVSINLTFFLIFQQTLIANSLIVDVNAAKTNQANIEQSRNNIPIVNIVKPNVKGISHNKFSEYNVDKKGLILNNYFIYSNK